MALPDTPFHRFLFCRFPRQTDSRFVVRSLPEVGSNQSPEVKDFVRKVSPLEPGSFRLQVAMSSRLFIGQVISLAIAMQILGGYPAEFHISTGKVRFDPSDTLTRVQSIFDPELQVAVSSFGLAPAGLQGLHRFDGTFTVTNHFMW
eukprot:3546326-Amphidinium_carterae.1